MKMTHLKKSLSLTVCIVLIAAMALFAAGCNGSKDTSGDNIPDTDISQSDIIVLGEGETSFYLTVTDAEGTETHYQINTEKKTVGDALIELNLIAGEEGAFGLYVKTVGGITVDYDRDGKYWAFYINGNYADKGVDSTDIEAGAEYSFKVE